jgi:hypothetical protein
MFKMGKMKIGDPSGLLIKLLPAQKPVNIRYRVFSFVWHDSRDMIGFYFPVNEP